MTYWLVPVNHPLLNFKFRLLYMAMTVILLRDYSCFSAEIYL